MLGVFDAARYAQHTTGAHNFVVQANTWDLPLVIDAGLEGMQLRKSQRGERVGGAEALERVSYLERLSFPR